jgi:hypothetical protein
MKRKKPHITQEQKHVESIPTIEEVSKIQPLEIEPHTKLVEKEVKTVGPEVGTEPLVVEQIEATKIVVEETLHNTFFSFFIIF